MPQIEELHAQGSNAGLDASTSSRGNTIIAPSGMCDIVSVEKRIPLHRSEIEIEEVKMTNRVISGTFLITANIKVDGHPIELCTITSDQRIVEAFPSYESVTNALILIFTENESTL